MLLRGVIVAACAVGAMLGNPVIRAVLRRIGPASAHDDPDVRRARENLGLLQQELPGGRWVGMLEPPRMDPALAARISEAMQRVFEDQAFQQRILAMGVERDFRPAPALLAAMQRDDRIWAAAAQAGHIRPQQ